MSAAKGNMIVLPQIGRRCQYCVIKDDAKPDAELSIVCTLTGIGKMAEGLASDTLTASPEMQARCPRVNNLVDKKTCRER